MLGDQMTGLSLPDYQTQHRPENHGPRLWQPAAHTVDTPRAAALLVDGLASRLRAVSILAAKIRLRASVTPEDTIAQELLHDLYWFLNGALPAEFRWDRHLAEVAKQRATCEWETRATQLQSGQAEVLAILCSRMNKDEVEALRRRLEDFAVTSGVTRCSDDEHRHYNVPYAQCRMCWRDHRGCGYPHALFVVDYGGARAVAKAIGRENQRLVTTVRFSVDRSLFQPSRGYDCLSPVMTVVDLHDLYARRRTDQQEREAVAHAVEDWLLKQQARETTPPTPREWTYRDARVIRPEGPWLNAILVVGKAGSVMALDDGPGKHISPPHDHTLWGQGILGNRITLSHS